MSVLYNGSRRGKGTFLGEKTNAKAAARGSKEAREKRDQANMQDGSAPSETPVRRSAEKPSKDIKKPTAQRISTDREPAGEITRASGQTATDGTAGKARRLVRKAATRRPAPGAAATPKATARPQHARRSPARWQAAARKQKRRLGKPRRLRESRLDASWHGCP